MSKRKTPQIASIAELFAERCTIPFREEATAFSEPFQSDLRRWWKVAPRGDWMLWVAWECGAPEGAIIAAAADCVRIGFRFDPNAAATLEPFLKVAERGGLGKLDSAACRRAADEAYEYEKRILAACSLENTLSAAHVAGACSRLATAAGVLHNAPECVTHAAGALTQIAAAGRYLDGEDSQTMLHLQCANSIRTAIRIAKLSLPKR